MYVDKKALLRVKPRTGKEEKMEKKLLHVFIIPDGNRRWTKNKCLNSWEGHMQGYEVLRSLLKQIWSLEITHFTFWGLSMDNFANRPEEEIKFIMYLFEKAIDELTISQELEKEKVRMRIIGRWKEFCDQKLRQKVAKLEEKTFLYYEKHFTLLFGYSGDEELAEAVTELHKITPVAKKIMWRNIRNWLPTRFLPDVDIMIRTGFEPHLSAAALCMQMKNAHLYFPQMHWPDFTIEELAKITDDFKNRERRFGA